jgi:nucleoside-diphosphate-sugar epimerase
MSPPTVTRPNLIVGCGYLGRRVAAGWLAAGREVVALTRRNADALAARDIQPLVGDVLDPASLRALPAADTVLYAVGMDRSAGKSMREVYVGGLANVLGTLPACERFVYVSSTGVYGQSDGSLVHEDSATEPREESGRVVLEAERLLRDWMPGAIILRFAGIYGPDRLLRKQAILSGEPLVGDANKWLNLIHAEDGADAVLSAESRGVPGQTYIVADDEPVPRRDFYTLLAELLGTTAKFQEQAEPEAANRRVSNAKAKCDLAWSPQFPSYREGLRAAI